MIIENTKALVETLDNIRQIKKINFIPTMGNLHDGHLSLIKKSQKKGFFSLVSIYVNPLQFSEKNDFKNYPRTLNKDLELLKKHNINLIFLPKKSFADTSFSVDIGKIGNKLCGVDRPGHFSGVALVILKFLNLIQPHFMTLGQKDYQQILVIKKLIKDFFFKTKLITISTSREKNGLAMSSRNQLISDKRKHLTKMIFETMNNIAFDIETLGLKKSKINYFRRKLLKVGIEKVNYIEVLKEESLSDLDSTPAKCRIFISITIDGVRLIDNMAMRKGLVKKEGLIRTVEKKN
ncbi:MAG: pantoate--beta-alanine ligase [Rickettsiales bacterium]|nr:pantoate--beta-alanine ligase [Rickettsiales bacterium]RPG14088.1 MAG: pantoate--beta-alanine ligase [Pelagibacteraceae bacterium TMED195]|tara:strand:- start:998 stop:1873 length:876 start_codon:yes stop_codon:yes gene_type:complete